MASYLVVDCTLEDHGDAILEILNEAIITSTALFDYRERTAGQMASWFQVKQENNYPVIGLVSPEGELMGFASWGSFRAFPAYKYTVEHSVYVHKDFRGQGLGTALLNMLIERAQQSDIHALIAGIDASNKASIQLHTRSGFVHVGTLPETGFKFGRWLDLAFYQLTLGGPHNPVDG